jgi:anti-sigma B factor antagonist
MIEDRPVATLQGELDLSSTALLRDTILDAADGTHAPELLVDFSEVTFLDSSGLRALLEVRTTLDGRGVRLVVVNASERVQRVLEITDTAQLFSAGG